MTQPNATQKTQDQPAQQQQGQTKNDPSRRDQRPQTMPGSQGVESPGQGELKRSKPGEEQGQANNAMNRQDEDSEDQDGKNPGRSGDASASKRDAGSCSGGSAPGQKQCGSNDNM